MKLALIFLSALVVISHQQFYQQRPARGMLWWLPYSPQRLLNSYQQPLYNDHLQQDELPFQRQLTSPTEHIDVDVTNFTHLYSVCMIQYLIILPT
jgi:hypothetical protein